MATFEGIDYLNEFHEVGESFRKDGILYVTLAATKPSSATCEGCAFNNEREFSCGAPELNCVAPERKDRTSVIYKMLSDEVEQGTPA